MLELESANVEVGAGTAALLVRTGIAVLQVPAGVAWQPGDTVRLAVGIAARSGGALEP
jgi:mannitol/fructose-specific phosphotransferase system IIA component